jgi:hypothetical protein
MQADRIPPLPTIQQSDTLKYGLGVLTDGLSVSLVLVVLAGSPAPGNEPGPEVGEWKDRLKTTPIGMDLVKTEEAMIDESKSYPAPVGRIGTDDGADISTFIVRYEMKLRSVWTDGDDVL